MTIRPISQKVQIITTHSIWKYYFDRSYNCEGKCICNFKIQKNIQAHMISLKNSIKHFSENNNSIQCLPEERREHFPIHFMMLILFWYQSQKNAEYKKECWPLFLMSIYAKIHLDHSILHEGYTSEGKESNVHSIDAQEQCQPLWAGTP